MTTVWGPKLQDTCICIPDDNQSDDPIDSNMATMWGPSIHDTCICIPNQD